MAELNLFGQAELWVAVWWVLQWWAIPAGALAAAAWFVISPHWQSRQQDRRDLRKLRRGHYPW